MTLMIPATEQDTGDDVMDEFTNLMLRVANALSLSCDGSLILTKEGEGFTKLTRAYQILVEKLESQEYAPLFAILSNKLTESHYRTLCEVINSRRLMEGGKSLIFPCFTPPENKPPIASSPISFNELCNTLHSIMH